MALRVFLFGFLFCFCSFGFTLNVTKVGSLPKYLGTGEKSRTELSGMIEANGLLVGVDDSSHPKAPLGVYLFKLVSGQPLLLQHVPLDPIHQDLEGITKVNNSLWVTTSISKKNIEGSRLSEIRLVQENAGKFYGKVVRSINPKKSILAALKSINSKWYDRIESLSAKQGGLNVEALSVAQSPGRILIGLRSPLYDPEFGIKGKLDKGKAIVLEAELLQSDIEVKKIYLLNLKGHGVRGMEYIPRLKQHMVIGGSIPKLKDFNLFTWSESKEPIPITMPAFNKLCRPETVFPVKVSGKDHIMIASEDSGKYCVSQPFSYILVEIKP